MIDSARLRRLLLLAALLFFLSAGIAFSGGFPGMAGGLLLGFGLGALPFASWGWIAARGMKSARARALVVVLLVVKLGLYAGALYFFVTRKLVDPMGVMAGITGVVAILTIGVLLVPAPAKEAA